MPFTKHVRWGADAAAWEVASLRWLADAEQHGGARVARVLDHDGATIELERLDTSAFASETHLRFRVLG